MNSPTINSSDKPAPPPTTERVRVWSEKQDELAARPSNMAGFCPHNKPSACVQTGLHPFVAPTPDMPGRPLPSRCSSHLALALPPGVLSLPRTPQIQPGPGSPSRSRPLRLLPLPHSLHSASSGHSRGSRILWVVV
ncbi:hypothetical protein HJG60_008299 [Phyllostomus discolor]|uniref:Uncharacterized protein n=1 Tax=Phyllostomus discolor TaxID=89673 RepID=A0A834DQJ2_9CHIR|nr:hypothetical protein HJG60_008299 [Phyllostomus discolor]